MGNNMMLSTDSKIMINGNLAVAANIDNGSWIKFPKECIDILNRGIKARLTEEELLEQLDEDDKDYFKLFVEKLKSMKLLMNQIEVEKDLKNNFKLESVSFTITNRCNLFCKHCIVSAGTLKDKEILTTDEIFSIIDKLGACGLRTITITGGEPMVRDDFFEITRYIHDKWEMDIDLMTNGTLINESNAGFLAAYVKSINISLDGADEETCRIIRGKGTFEKVMNAIKVLKENNHKEISLSIVETKKNIACIDKFMKMCEDLQVTPMRRIFEESGRAAENKEALNENISSIEAPPKDLTIDFLRNMSRARTCKAGEKTISIKANGDITPCQVFLDDKLIMGNITKIQDLQRFLLSDFKQTTSFESLKRYKPEHYKHCESCNVNWFCMICPHELELMISGKKSLQAYCKSRKQYLEKLVWGE